jgi:hypothetical protein
MELHNEIPSMITQKKRKGTEGKGEGRGQMGGEERERERREEDRWEGRGRKPSVTYCKEVIRLFSKEPISSSKQVLGTSFVNFSQK